MKHNYFKTDLASVGVVMFCVVHVPDKNICVVSFLLLNITAIGCGSRQQSEDNVAVDTLKRSSVTFPEKVSEPRKLGDYLGSDHADFQPVSISAELVPISASNYQLQLFLTIAPGWHIEATQGSYKQSLEIDLRLPEALVIASDWNMPDPNVQLSGSRIQKVYTGKLKLIRRLVLVEKTDHFSAAVQCVVTFQACDLTRCRDIETISTTARFRHDPE